LLVVFIKFITYFCLLFLSHNNSNLYRFADDAGIYTHRVILDEDALIGRILLSIIGLICGALSTLISFWGWRKSRRNKIIKYIFAFLLITSVIEMRFCGYRHVELQSISHNFYKSQ
jgi:hypothetical protein